MERFCGIVLRTIKYSDNLMIADVFTRSHGRMSFLVPVSRNRASRVRSVLFQPLSILSFSAPFRRGKSLVRVSDVQPYVLYSSLPYDVVKSSIALFLAEFLTYVLREEGENEPLFAFLDYAFSWFDETESGYADFHILFMAQLTKFLGIYPNVEDFSPGCFFDLVAGFIVKEHPLHSQYLFPDDTENFVYFLKLDFNSLKNVSLNRATRGEYLTLLLNYYRLHIPDFPELKSTAVLHELFS